METAKTIGIVGAGAWGTALAHTLANGGRAVTLWAYEPEAVKAINEQQENTLYLPGIKLNPNIAATDDLKDIVNNDIIMLVTPAQHLRTSLEQLKDHIHENQPIVICSKGIELETGLLLSMVADEVIPKQPVAILTGPTFAGEIARGLPSAVTIACVDPEVGKTLQESIGVKTFRPYLTEDIIGAQLGGALKNVIAIACGIVAGRKMGDSARAALLTRGIAEIGRLTVGRGGERETLLGMCGVGDLMLTCSSMQSRNYSLGFALGEGKALEDVLSERNSVTEGVYTAQSALKLAARNAVDMPITETMNKLLTGTLTIDDAIEDMLNRPFKY